ncbi:MAG TPA: glycine--tRNA ligase subunit beta [Thermoanaerobaculia bacterium]|nr:glycine--tRNA ligase subunit beta [Thermoanaerobaculia bacterium]
MAEKGEYFFELLTEEIPAWMLEARLEQLHRDLADLCSRYAGAAADKIPIRTGATSRRIYFRLGAMPARQSDRVEEIKGPPVRIAYDGEGRPTAALAGFLKKNQLSLESLTSERSDEYIRVTRKLEGLTAIEFLSAEIPRLIQTMRWPKLMRWGGDERTFIRPVHSAISIFDGKVVPLHLLGVTSGRATEGHRILRRDSFEVSSFDDYLTKTKNAKVVIDADDRLAQMRERGRVLGDEVSAQPVNDSPTWGQWKYLTEAAGVVRAEFDRAYLELPEEILVTVMRVHQKQLPLYNGDQLTHYFLAVMDNVDDREGNAASGNAFVTNARFADARFFHQTDRRTKLQDRIESLRHLQFHEKLGNYHDKRARIMALVDWLAGTLHLPKEEAVEAASLCKVDLVTEMVKEFTELQGQVGGIYAREEGYPESVWKAIYDHYRPVAMDGLMPESESGALVSTADKLDTLAGFFLIGARPTGSKDPFALRRTAQGIVQVVLQREWPVDIQQLVERALAGYSVASVAPNVADDMMEFMAERLRTLLGHESFAAFSYDEIDAAMAAGWRISLPDLWKRAAAVHNLRDATQFISILDSAKRIANIVGQQTFERRSRSPLGHPTAEQLADAVDEVEKRVTVSIADGDYAGALELFATLAPQLELFFKDVMVMVDDTELRDERLALLDRVGRLVSGIADVTRLVVNRREYDTATA